MKIAPVVLFVYNRPWHTEVTLNSLKENELSAKSTLYIYSDGPKKDATDEDLEKINNVRRIIRDKQWCGEIIIKERAQNLGLAESIKKGVSEVIELWNRVIVLEDDIKVDPLFLNYMNSALDAFEEKKEVFHINGYNNESHLQFFLEDFYFLRFMNCWGWATWEDRWKKIILDHNKIYKKLIRNSSMLSEFNYENTLNFHRQLEDNMKGSIRTWAILWYSTIFLNRGLCLTPKYSLVENIGLDGSGIHSTKTSFHSRIYPPISSFSIKKLQDTTIREKWISRWHLKLFYRCRRSFVIKKIFNAV